MTRPPGIVSAAAVCPSCHGPLAWSEQSSTCRSCQAQFATLSGAPILSAAPHDPHKRQQQRFFDEEADPEFEIERPYGTPALYQWLIREKFARSVSTLRQFLPHARVLTVCGGSGMDAEYLARAGARVVVSDLSLEAVARALERARRRGLDIAGVVADIEALPFDDRSFDIVYVHDGLHHLQDPFAGLAEMARVASVAVSVNEPARAALTSLAIRLGAAQEEEEAGNRIERLDPARMAAELRACGFQITVCERYGMYYRHEPGWVFRTLSRRVVFPVVRGAIQALNVPFGRFGNKFTLQAIRVN